MFRLAGPLYTCHAGSKIFHGSIKYIHTFLHSLVRITSLFFRGGGSIRKPDRSTNLSVVKLKALKLRHMYVLLNEISLNDLAITLNKPEYSGQVGVKITCHLHWLKFHVTPNLPPASSSFLILSLTYS